MVGQAVCRRLEADGYDWIGRTSSEVDLRDQAETRTFFEEVQPDFVVLAAATVGGILANDTYPADFLYNNTAIATNVIQAAHETDVDRLIFLGSSCIYPKHCEALHSQHGDDFLSLMPTNLYGIGDDFDLETSHVLPALLRKVHEAKGAGPNGDDAPVTMWGTGTPKREFLFVDDLADAVLHILHQPEDDIREVAPDGLLNVGVGEDLSINDLMATIKDVVGSESPVEHDLSKPDGTPRKLLDVSRMQSLGWEADTSLREGIRQTYAWYDDRDT
jgi:GDP-L-fucose synthase